MFFLDVDGMNVMTDASLFDLIHRDGFAFARQGSGHTLFRFHNEGLFVNNVNFRYTFDGFFFKKPVKFTVYYQD